MHRALVSVILLLSVALAPPAGAQQTQNAAGYTDPYAAPAVAAPDCGSDLDCFIEYARGCWPAVVTWRPGVEVFGIRWYSTTRLQIKEQLDDQCMVLVRLMSLDASYSPELVQEAVAAGATFQEVAAAELETSQQAQAYAGTESTCAFQSVMFPIMLERWKLYGFTALDWSLLQCG